MALRTATAALAVGLAALLAGCGEKEEGGKASPDPLHVVLDFYPNPDHAGIYVAEQRGYFREAGLDVEISTPTDPAAPIRQVAAGRADLAVSYEPEVLLAREQGLDVVAVGALVDEPLTSLIWLERSDVRGPEDLAGETVATAGIPYQAAYLRSILGRAGADPGDVEQVNVGLGLLPALLGGRAAAILGGFRNVEGVDLRLRGERPVVQPVDRLGVPRYDELVLVAGGDRVDEDPEAIRLFLAALERGTSAAAADPGAATDAVLEANSALDPRLTAAEMRATLPLLGREQGEPYGWMDPAEWDAFIRWMRDHGVITALPAPSEALTNELLPRAGSR
ncbi:MAG TPA: ABC transporter substrate-binding protein [Solirubrobacterales bacterium]|nr:ABC transporter substrate-binding protein [Solirubrobacterales bacterium]